MKSSETRLQMKKFIKAKRERVFQAWTQPELIKKWFAPGEMTVPIAESQPVIGGKYRIQMKNPETNQLHNMWGVYKEIVPNQRLVFTWSWQEKEPHETQVTVEFCDKDGGTEITLTHEGFINEEQIKSHTQGWNGCLANLESRIARL